MDIHKKEFCGYTIFELRGEVAGGDDLEKIKKTVDKAIQGDKENVAILLHNCDYMDSGLIGFFMGWNKALKMNNKKFCLIEPSQKALEVLNVTGIPRAIEIFKNEVEFAQKARPD
jgi:anti-anti-sigma factor